MFYSLRGKIVYYDSAGLAIECAGVAYYCQTTLQTLSHISSLEGEALLYTHMSFRQDAVELFAFADKPELNCFRMLIGVSGVGPKAALAILSVMTPERLALCVASGDDKSITQAQGVGKKLAQRIVLELKDKVAKADISQGFRDMPAINPNMSSGSAGEAISALVVLGYAQADAASIISSLDADMSVEDMIKAGLKALAGKL